MTRTADVDDRPLDRILFSSPVLEIGMFRVRPAHPLFNDSGPIQRHIVVFPRTLVRITHEGGDPFVAGPDVVTFYNRGQVYRRDSVYAQPDRCEWFAFSPAILTAALSEVDPAVEDRPSAPFRLPCGPSDPRSYLEQRSGSSTSCRAASVRSRSASKRGWLECSAGCSPPPSDRPSALTDEPGETGAPTASSRKP